MFSFLGVILYLIFSYNDNDQKTSNADETTNLIEKNNNNSNNNKKTTKDGYKLLHDDSEYYDNI